MKIGIQTWGSHGDVEPFLALAEGLVDAGHEVLLTVTTQGDKDLISPPGVEIERVGRPMSQAEGDALLERAIKLSSPMAQGRLVLEEGFLPFAEDMYDAAVSLAERSDLLVRHHFLYMTQAAAESAGVPEVSVFLTPDLLPTREHPPTGMPSFGPLQNFAWWLAKKGIGSVFGPPAQKLRKRVGLPRARGVLDDIWASNTANLIAVSPSLFRRPEDWPAHYHLTGFWRAPSATTQEIEDELDAFISSGAPPVYATFGSMGAGSGERMREDADLLVRACRLTGHRLILQQPEADKPHGEDVYCVVRSPHRRVFERCCAVIHHGGAGTTQTAVLAGTPSIVVPHLADQFFWAEHVERMGVGVAAPPRSKIRVPKLAAAIRKGSSEARHEQCQRVAGHLAEEDGVARAVEAISALAPRTE